MDLQTINAIIQAGADTQMTLVKFLEKEIQEWKTSPRRMMMLQAEDYYQGNHDILARKRTALGKDGKLTEVDNLPNNKIVDNQYANAVDKKVNYSFARPFSVDTDETYSDLLNVFFNNRFRLMFKSMSRDAINGGIGWLCPHYDANGQFKIRRFRPWEILPFWADDDHTELDAYARLYTVKGYEGEVPVSIEKVDFVTKDGISHYVFYNGALIPDVEQEDSAHFAVVRDGQEQPLNWERIPLVAFKFDDNETSLLRRVKSLQDGINVIASDFMNAMQEDARNTILVLENYDGQNLAEFRHNLALYGVVKVSSSEGARGGVTTLTVEVNKDNYQAIYNILKDALIENARSMDAKDDRMGNSPNQMNIQSMYSDLDLDANGIEAQFQASFEELLWFISNHLANSGAGDYSTKTVALTFNRDMLMNETEAITNCKNSTGVISKRTIVANHPWVVDVDQELADLEEEEQAMMEKFSVADPTLSGSGDQGGGGVDE